MRSMTSKGVVVEQVVESHGHQVMSVTVPEIIHLLSSVPHYRKLTTRYDRHVSCRCSIDLSNKLSTG